MTGAHDQLLDELRPAAFAIAYRMLGSVAEAEDVVQEALLRVLRALEEGQRIESPRAYVATVTTRLSIDQLRSARVRRETYVGEWLPEPLVAILRATRRARPRWPTRCRSRSWSCSRASHRSSARCCCCATCSTTATGSRHDRRQERGQHPPAGRPGAPRLRSASALRGLARAARRAGAALLRGRAGGRPRRARGAAGRRRGAARRRRRQGARPRPLAHGRSRVARTLLAWMRQGARSVARRQPVEVNGQPGALLLDGDEQVISVMALDIADRVQACARS